MSVLDLIKATVTCGLLAFFTFNYFVLGQILIIGTLSVVWLSYAFKTFRSIRQK